MEYVLTTEYIKDIVMDYLTIRELNNIRACSKDLQRSISEYSEQKMNRYLIIINRKVDRLRQDTLSTIYDMPYTVIYNYYHTIIKYSCLVLESHTHTELQKLMRCFRDKYIIHSGRKYTFDNDRYKQSDITMHNYSLLDIMAGIYLANTGNDWTSYHWSGEGVDVMRFLQGRLLPLS